MHRPRFVPSSTYRLQVHGGFPLTAARAIVPYLKRLGIGAVYTSPYFAAEPGSTHGYDVTNHNELNAEVGGIEAHVAFSDAVMAAGLQHVVDFVPNHMGISTTTNPWWRDVLENGPKSPAAGFFDIDWRPVKEELRQKLLLPILGDQYGVVLERGDLQLAFRDGHLLLTYGETELPINPRQVPRVYRTGLTALTTDLGPTHPDLIEFLGIVNALQSAPATNPSADSGDEPVRDAIRSRLKDLTDRSPRIRQHIEAALREFNGAPGRPESFDALHEVLEEQAYRLAYWRTASHEINYRRFFDINALAGLRVESPTVFASIHRLLERLIGEGRVTGVRIDHPDGLFDPRKYFDMLQDLAAAAWNIPRQPDSRPMYVVAEKILSGRERLPSWCVHGTTGYNFLNQVNGLFVNPANARQMRRVYARLTGRSESFDDLLYDAKRLIMDTSLASELNVLAHMLNRISESNRKSRDFTLNSLRDAIVEVVACFPVYRTYVTEHGWTPEDRASVERAIVRARRRNPATDPTIFDFFREVVLPRDPEDTPAAGARDRREGYAPADPAEAAARLRFAMKFQQYTGPVQAKGLEDTTFYRYNVLLSLNEVGGDPSRFGVSPQEFHELNRARLAEWPFEMITTSTHDTKLGEDVRARIDVLSELPDEWGREVSRWMRMNRDARVIVDGEPAPDRNDEYRFYQALVGMWPHPPEGGSATPEIVDRLRVYMTKSAKEAKVFSSWINPNDAYEAALTTFVERVLTGDGGAKFLASFQAFQDHIARVGLVNSLAQTVLKIASPGVPDFYQGTELWDLNLVDPDNRRPIDFNARLRELDRVDAVLAACPERRAAVIRPLAEQSEDGAIKLLVTAAGLRLRSEMPALFLDADYVPLATDLTVSAGAIAFARVLHGPDGASVKRAMLVIVPHLVSPIVDAEHPLPVGDVWKTSRVLLPPALGALTYHDAFTGAEIKPMSTASGDWLFVGQALQALPVAMLVSS